MSAINDLQEVARRKVDVGEGLRVFLRGLASHVAGYGMGRMMLEKGVPAEVAAEPDPDHPEIGKTEMKNVDLVHEHALTRADMTALASDIQNNVEGIVRAICENTALDPTTKQG